MNECLKEQLKGVINNDNLRFFDTIVLEVRWHNFTELMLKQYNQGIKFGGVGLEFSATNATFRKGASTNVGASYTMDDANETVKIIATDTSTPSTIFIRKISNFEKWNSFGLANYIYSDYKDVLPYITIGESILFIPGNTDNTDVDCAFLAKMPNPESFTSFSVNGYLKYKVATEYFGRFTNLVQSLEGDWIVNGLLANIAAMTKITNFSPNSASVLKGSVSAFANMTDITTISLSGFTEINGNVESLGACTLLGILLLGDTQVSGDLKTLALSQISNNRTTGSIRVRSNGIMQFNEEHVDSGRVLISWTSADDITCTPNGW